MPRFQKEVDVVRGRGATVTWEYAFAAQDRALHKALGKRLKVFFANFRRSYSRRVPKRTGALSRGFSPRVYERTYGRRRSPVVVVRYLRHRERHYAYIVEHGGPERVHAGTRRAHHMRRVFGTERRKLNKSVKIIMGRIYGA